MNYMDKMEHYRNLSLDEKVRLKPDRNIGLLNMLNEKLHEYNIKYNQSMALGNDRAADYYSNMIDKHKKARAILSFSLSTYLYNRKASLEKEKNRIQKNILKILISHDENFKLDKDDFRSGDLFKFAMFWHSFKDEPFQDTSLNNEMCNLKSIEKQFSEVERLNALFTNNQSTVDPFGNIKEDSLSEDVIKLPNHLLVNLVESVVNLENAQKTVIEKTNKLTKSQEEFVESDFYLSFLIKTLVKIKARAHVYNKLPLSKKVSGILKNTMIGFSLGVPTKLSNLTANFDYTIITKEEAKVICGLTTGLFTTDYISYAKNKNERNALINSYASILESATAVASILDETIRLPIYSYTNTKISLQRYIEIVEERRLNLKKYIAKTGHSLDDKYSVEQYPFILGQANLEIELPFGTCIIKNNTLINKSTDEEYSFDIFNLFDFDRENEIFTNLSNNSSISCDEWLAKAILKENEE